MSMLSEVPSSEKLKQFYDEKYKRGYMGQDRYGYWSHSGAQLLRILETLQHVAIYPSRILDYGCGQSAWIDILSTCFPQAKLYGIDISDIAINKAMLHFPQWNFSVFDGTKIPFSNSFFDFIYSYHVLEHVTNVEASITDICRVVKKGGYVCIIFPCGNQGSFEERIMKLMEDGIQITSEGRKVHFYETAIGHLRRMSSYETIKLFEENGLVLKKEFYSDQFFGWIDWLVRGHDSNTINRMLNNSKAVNGAAKLKLFTIRTVLLILNWIVSKKSINLSIKRNLTRSIVAFLAKAFGIITDRLVSSLAICEWRLFKHCRSGSAQFLVFQKTSS
jgi:ubiquinone/menaquinone biosynthesis C-methylase UbiE